jgi:hypothetical protein
MSPLAERSEFATLVGKLPFGYCGEVAWFWLFFELHNQSACGAILYGSRKLTQAINGLF